MAAGLVPSKNQLDTTMGSIALSLNEVMTQIHQMQEYLAAQADADLEAQFGYSAQDVANFKSAFADLDQLRTIYEGAASLSAAKDFRAFASRIWGIGFE